MTENNLTANPSLDDELKKSNILIVDDNPANVSLLEFILEDEGYDNVTSTTDPRLVLPLCRKQSFDLILLDIRMPYMSGHEVMEQLQKELSDEHLAILTAQTDMQTQQDALKLGAKDFVTKPFEQWEVMLRIHNMLETRYFYKQQLIRGDVLEEEVRNRTEEIRLVQLEIVRRLGLAGEFRDNETGAHVVRMSQISEIIGRGAGLDEKTCELILYSSPMHDIGKIGIPDNILLKPGKLNGEEWEIMKNHAQIGRDIIGDYPADIMWMAGIIALSHHEKWDGSGYPQGLKGEDIPIYGRIAAISDVFDALLSRRPYKEPWPLDKAVTLIREEAGRHFDPRLVQVFVDNLDEILAIEKNNAD
ncbi:MAG: response regulator [Desulfobulbaceae bacterium]|nr:MAG: response regulator [Desulfobulbaceae bacterium]